MLETKPQSYRSRYDEYTNNFESNFRHVSSWLIVQGYARNSQDAEDFAQEALLLGWRNLEKFRGECSMSTWLIAIARNWVLYELRKSRYTKEVFIDETAHDCKRKLALGPSEFGSEEMMETSIVVEEVLSQVNNLADGYRTNLLMKGAGYPSEEISEMTGKTVTAVDKNVFDARRRLKKNMDDSYGKDAFPIAHLIFSSTFHPQLPAAVTV